MKMSRFEEGVSDVPKGQVRRHDGSVTTLTLVWLVADSDSGDITVHASGAGVGFSSAAMLPEQAHLLRDALMRGGEFDEQLNPMGAPPIATPSELNSTRHPWS
jgi:hypothetical protein